MIFPTISGLKSESLTWQHHMRRAFLRHRIVSHPVMKQMAVRDGIAQ